MTSNLKKGIILALCAAFISGISIFYNKLVVVKGIDSTIFNIAKNSGTALIISMILLGKSQKTSFSSLTKKTWTYLFLIGIIGGTIPFVLFFEGLKTVPAINASIIQKSLFIWVALLAIPLLKEKLTSLQIIGYLLVVASNFFIGGFKGFSLTSSEGMILIATLFWSVENIIAKRAVEHISSTVIVWGRMFLGTIFLLLFAIISGKIGLFSQITPQLILPIAGSILLLTGYTLSWYKSLSLAPVTLVTAILILSTPITNVLSAVFITHVVDPSQVVSGVLSIVGVLFIGYFGAKIAHDQHPGISSVQ